MEKKPIRKTTLLTEDALYEMTHDPRDKRSWFEKYTRFGKHESLLESVTVGETTFEPLLPSHTLVERGIVLFPSIGVPYGSDEELLAEIQTFIHKYVDISPEFEALVPYYVLFTWIYDRFHEVPYIRAIGDFGSGKSRFLQTVGSLCYKPTFTGGATTSSPIFRIIDEIRGTLVLDEADYKFSDMTTDIVKVLNMGYSKGGSVLRMEGKGILDIRAFDVFGPKIVATRELFSDRALESRFLVEHMGAGKLRRDIPRTLTNNFYFEAETIRNKLLMWRFEHFFKPLEISSEILEGIHPRLNQIVIPLLSVMPHEETRDRLKTFVAGYHSDLIADRGMSMESEIVGAIYELWNGLESAEILVKDITATINKENEFEDIIKPKKVGWYLRSRLQLRTRRTRNGYAVPIAINKQHLESWKERLGIESTPKDELVNEVNVADVPVTSDINPANLPF